jgi:hypothetical protein
MLTRGRDDIPHESKESGSVGLPCPRNQGLAGMEQGLTVSDSLCLRIGLLREIVRICSTHSYYSKRFLLTSYDARVYSLSAF